MDGITKFKGIVDGKKIKVEGDLTIKDLMKNIISLDSKEVEAEIIEEE